MIESEARWRESKESRGRRKGREWKETLQNAADPAKGCGNTADPAEGGKTEERKWGET